MRPQPCPWSCPRRFPHQECPRLFLPCPVFPTTPEISPIQPERQKQSIGLLRYELTKQTTFLSHPVPYAVHRSDNNASALSASPESAPICQLIPRPAEAGCICSTLRDAQRAPQSGQPHEKQIQHQEHHMRLGQIPTCEPPLDPESETSGHQGQGESGVAWKFWNPIEVGCWASVRHDIFAKILVVCIANHHHHKGKFGDLLLTGSDRPAPRSLYSVRQWAGLGSTACGPRRHHAKITHSYICRPFLDRRLSSPLQIATYFFLILVSFVKSLGNYGLTMTLTKSISISILFQASQCLRPDNTY